jgi:hypothetical protein
MTGFDLGLALIPAKNCWKLMDSSTEKETQKDHSTTFTAVVARERDSTASRPR